MTFGINFEDLSQHVYVLGPTRCGKTTLMANMALQLLNAQDKFPCSVVWIDPKGLDCKRFFGVVPDIKKTTYLDPSLGFGVNPLTLPETKVEKERIVSLYVSNLLSLLNEWFRTGGVTFTSYAPRATHLVEVVLRCLYAKTDRPTFADIYFICSKLRRGGQKDVEKIQDMLGAKEDLKRVVQDVSRYEAEAWDPLLTRFGKFAMDTYLRHIFCPKNVTFDIFAALKPGNFTILNASEQTLGQESANLIMSAFVVCLWFAAMIRSELENKNTPVVLFVDEFHRTGELGVISPLVSMASAFGIYLVLAHQSLAQLDHSLRQLVLANTAIQIAGRVGGEDARIIVDFWRPGDRELLQKLSTLARHEFLARDATSTAASPSVVRFRTRDWPAPVRDWSTVSSWLKTQRQATEPAPLLVEELEKPSWRELLPVPLFREIEWKIMNAFAEKSWTKEALQKYLEVPVDVFNHAFSYLVSNKYVGIKTRTKTTVAYCLLKRGADTMAKAYDFADVGGPEAAALAREYVKQYGKDRFVVVSLQPHRGGTAPDLIEYNYGSQEATAIEIETTSELRSHPDQVSKNAVKNLDYGFAKTKFVVKQGDGALVKKIIGEEHEVVEIG